MDIKVCDTVLVRGSFGLDAPQEVIVEYVDFHKGVKVIDYRDSSGNGHWAYFHQIDKIISK